MRIFGGHVVRLRSWGAALGWRLVPYRWRRGCRVLGGGERHYRWVSKTDTSDDRFYEPALAPHGIYLRGKAIWALSNGLVTRNHRAGSFETVRGAALEGGSVVINCI